MSDKSLIANVTQEKCLHCGGIMTFVHEEVGWVHNVGEDTCDPYTDDGINCYPYTTIKELLEAIKQETGDEMTEEDLRKEIALDAIYSSVSEYDLIYGQDGGI